MRSVTLRQIEAFKALVELGTVSAAAEALHVSQPAMSKLIRTLEEDSGLDLFERVANRLVPTATGITLFEDIDRIFSGVDQIRRTIDTLRRQDEATLRVGLLPALGGRFAAALASAITREVTGAQLSIIVKESQILRSWVDTGQADLAVLSPLGQAAAPATSFMQRDAVAILPRAHPLAGADCLDPVQLSGLPAIALPEPSEMRRNLSDLFRAAGATLRFGAEATTLPAVCSMVEAGLGFAVVHPAAAVGADVAVRPFRPRLSRTFELHLAPSARRRRIVRQVETLLHRVSEEFVSPEGDETGGSVPD